MIGYFQGHPGLLQPMRQPVLMVRCVEEKSCATQSLSLTMMW